MGKVNSALSAVINGECISFEEEKQDSKSRVVIKERISNKEWIEKGVHSGSFDHFDFSPYLPAKIFISPGIDPRRPFFKALSPYEIKELDYFCENFKGWTLAVTGTDGKSTFTTQLGEVLKRAFPEQKIFVGGNLGNAMAEALLSSFDGAVLEISSFQAERLKTCRLDFGILLNLAIDHLDRYDQVEDYFAAKWNLLLHSKVSFCPQNVEIPKNLNPHILHSNEDSLLRILEQIAPQIVEKISDRKKKFDSSWLLDLPRLPHRLEVYSDSEGRFFVNDSKATTVHATRYGLGLLQEKFNSVFLIVGGRHKGDDFGEIAEALRPSDVLLICGEARDLIREQTSTYSIRSKSFPSLKELLHSELPRVKPGECLMLSPACSSYDEFKNFEVRGQLFCEQAKKYWGDLHSKELRDLPRSR